MIAGLRTLAGKQSSRGPGARTGLQASDVHCNCLTISCCCLVWVGQQSARTITQSCRDRGELLDPAVTLWLWRRPDVASCWTFLPSSDDIRIIPFPLSTLCIYLWLVEVGGAWHEYSSVQATVNMQHSIHSHRTSVRILLRTENKCSPIFRVCCGKNGQIIKGEF